MTDKKISELTNITGANLADTDEFVVVDTSATETKAITWAELKNGLDTSTGFVRITGDTMTGDLTINADLTATGGDLDLDTLDLKAIAASKAVTAVDVFVYDTSLDSDGGAWRKRCQHTSWYNEPLNTVTRGARREFPAVAVIVAETGKVTIYDGDDPSLPMWMAFGLGVGSLLTSFNSVSMRNGIMCAGSPASINFAGLLVARFLNDDAIGVRGHVYWNLHMNVPSISARNGTWQQTGSRGFLAYSSTSVLVSPSVNDVAMTVLPDAPVDPATGLPVPTIAVATAGGVSVIKDDETVVDITGGIPNTVVFTPENKLFFDFDVVAGGSRTFRVLDIPSADTNLALSTKPAGSQYYTTAIFAESYPADVAFLNGYASKAVPNAIGFRTSTSHLALIDPNPDDNTKAMISFVTSTYNTGWMNGDIKGAFLADTDDTDLVGSGELVTNGTFDADTNWTKGTGWTIGSGVATHAAGVGSDLEQAGAVVAGNLYALTLDVTAVRAASTLYVMAGPSNTYQVIEATVTAGTKVVTFVAPANGKLVIRLGGPADADIDNISVKLADADRSVSANGLVVNGTVTRSAVATGAELVAYSGFSASNYLEQPYNSDLDFGTGDFCVMGWVKSASSASTANIVSRCSGGTNGFQLYKWTTSATPYAVFRIGTTALTGTTGITDQWNHIVAVRKSGIAYIYKNGVLESSVSATADVSGAYVTQVGWSTTSPLITSLHGAALLRISATAPTAEQIAKIYEDEKVLFQENAAATLYGASDAVTALAHDPVTNELHVGTSAGRSVFQGLRRVSNTTTAVGTAISASNGLVVEE